MSFLITNASAPADFLIRYLDGTGREHLAAPSEAAGVAFESCLPVRDIPSYAGQHHTPGSYWSSTADAVLGYESFLEAKWLKLLDFDQNVVTLATQPFEFDGFDEHGAWRHTPDIFTRRGDGSVLLVDVKNPDMHDRRRVRRQAGRTTAACAVLGWEYELVGEPDPQSWATVAWLAGYRRPLRAGAALVEPILSLADRPLSIAEATRFQQFPELARAVVFHLMWHHALLFDATAPLRDHTVVRTDPALRGRAL